MPQKSRDTGISFHQGEGGRGGPRRLSNLSTPGGHVSTPLHTHTHTHARARPHAGKGTLSDVHTRSLVTYESTCIHSLYQRVSTACNTRVHARRHRQPSQGRKADTVPA